MENSKKDMILKMISSEYNSHFENILETLNLYFKRHGSDTNSIITAGLSVKNKKTKLTYTIDAVSSRDVTLKSPDGEIFKVSQADLEYIS